MTFTIPVPTDFNFKSTVHSHGWYDLAPFVVDRERMILYRDFRLSSGKNIHSSIAGQKLKKRASLTISTGRNLSDSEQNELQSLVKACLRLEEDYSDFYRETKKLKEFQWVHSLKAGRLLRSPTVWEDVVKMICTTNCSWALTKILTTNLCRKFGAEVKGILPIATEESSDKFVKQLFSFPEPGAIADSTEKYLRKEIRAGYRAPYLLELAKKVEKKEIDLESWRTSEMSTVELFKAVRSVKGVGPYAAGNLLKLLGHYDYLAIDSWCRKTFYEKHRKGKKVSDKTIEKFYNQFGKWRGLFFWMDLTQYWYEKEIIL